MTNPNPLRKSVLDTQIKVIIFFPLTGVPRQLRQAGGWRNEKKMCEIQLAAWRKAKNLCVSGGKFLNSQKSNKNT